jgi:hypothetical protein
VKRGKERERESYRDVQMVYDLIDEPVLCVCWSLEMSDLVLGFYRYHNSESPTTTEDRRRRFGTGKKSSM